MPNDTLEAFEACPEMQPILDQSRHALRVAFTRVFAEAFLPFLWKNYRTAVEACLKGWKSQAYAIINKTIQDNLDMGLDPEDMRLYVIHRMKEIEQEVRDLDDAKGKR